MRVTSEGPVRITRPTIDAAWRRRKPGHRLIVRDKDCRGLALIVNSTVMAWSYSYRSRGTDPLTGRRWPNKTVTLGNPETHSPDDARAEANRLKGQMQAGFDPVAEKKARMETERRKRGTTLSRLCDDYAVAFSRRPNMRAPGSLSPIYVTQELTQLRLALTAMQASDIPAGDLTEANIRLLLSTADGEGSTARKRFGALSRFLDWAQDAGHIPVNPCTLISRSRRPRAPQPRSHYLNPRQLAALWCAAGALSEPVWRDLARFLIAVPCRRGEAARLDWAHLDMEAGEWRQPGKTTKNREPHRLHLPPLALEVLRSRREATGGNGMVFPSPRVGRVINSFSKMKSDISSTSGIIGWTWHDFRRSFATALGEAGIPETVADAVLNHRQAATRGGVLGVYQRASRWPEQRGASEHWGRLLAAALDPPKATTTVVPMVARGG
jgi:integrase